MMVIYTEQRNFIEIYDIWIVLFVLFDFFYCQNVVATNDKSPFSTHAMAVLQLVSLKIKPGDYHVLFAQWEENMFKYFLNKKKY